MIDTRLAPYGLFALRAAVGLMFIAHAMLKYAVFTIPGFAGFLGQLGYPAALAWPVFLAELLGGAAILVGFYGRWVQAALLPVLVGALLAAVEHDHGALGVVGDQDPRPGWGGVVPGGGRRPQGRARRSGRGPFRVCRS